MPIKKETRKMINEKLKEEILKTYYDYIKQKNK